MIWWFTDASVCVIYRKWAIQVGSCGMSIVFISFITCLFSLPMMLNLTFPIFPHKSGFLTLVAFLLMLFEFCQFFWHNFFEIVSRLHIPIWVEFLTQSVSSSHPHPCNEMSLMCACMCVYVLSVAYTVRQFLLLVSSDTAFFICISLCLWWMLLRGVSRHLMKRNWTFFWFSMFH